MVPLEVSNDELSLLVLGWAKANMNDAYQATLKAASNPKIFNTYLLRLVEVRYQKDKEFRRQCTVSVLDQTSLAIRLKAKDGTVRIFSGRAAKGVIEHRIFELGLPAEEFAKLQHTKKVLDLEYIPELEAAPQRS